VDGGSAGARPDGRRSRGPSDGSLREQWRRERRALVRRHHPDVGGDPDLLQARLTAFDHRHRERQDALDAPAVVAGALLRPWLATRRLVHRTADSLRRRLPRRRRYLEI
jgi:hypothetical protein